MEKVEFEFPDPDKEEAKAKAPAAEADDTEFEVEVVDDTPAKDRGRKPAEPPTDVTDDELEGYSDKVKKRIQHFTRGYHDERRAKESALREREEALKLAQSIIEENKKLKSTVNQNQEALLEQAKRSADIELAQAKAQFRAAYEEGDPDKVTAAQESMTSAKLKADRVANFKLPALQEEESAVEIKYTAPVQQQVAQADPKVTAWQQDNPWFGSDDEMTSFALGLHQKLIKQGVDPQSDDYYDAINRRMRQVFPDQFEESEPDEKPRRKPVVAPATRTAAPRKIVLTTSQQAIAKRLGLTLEQYARQVAEDMRKQNG
jgi:hypothetical protein